MVLAEVIGPSIEIILFVKPDVEPDSIRLGLDDVKLYRDMRFSLKLPPDNETKGRRLYSTH